MSKLIKLYNRFHLGDQIFNFILFYNIKNYIEENDITIHYYCNNEYHWQISEFNCSKNILIFELNPNVKLDDGLHVWIGDRIYDICWYTQADAFQRKLNLFYVAFFNEVLQKLKIPVPFKKLEYSDPDLLTRYDQVNQRCNNKYAELDFLILNSTALSGQYYRNDAQWIPLILLLNEKYRIVTTEKVPGVNCTQEDRLSIKDIAAVSTKVKKIIAVTSGVITGLFNTYTLSNVEVIYTFSYNDCFKHPKIVSKTNITDLYSLV